MAALFSVAGGKYHKPLEPVERSKAWRPAKTLCGATVTPLNYFETEADADSHTGGRLSIYLCKRCGTAS